MAKLTKAQRKAHAEAEALLTKDQLSEDEREFVFRSWHEGAEFINGAAGAFFTPYDLAGDFALDGAGGRVIDLCAGIGILSYFIAERAKYVSRVTELTWIEINPRYCEVGRKLLPEARWINADVFDWRELDLGRYDIAVGNPPFGKVRRSAPVRAIAARSLSFTSSTLPPSWPTTALSLSRSSRLHFSIPAVGSTRAARGAKASTSRR